ncbi:MAG TPA: TetR family transcriptional regulator, partial [Candidatus Blautia pullicola]|nr:TetR family transcriptional regulator [Candidatus Blautia pullicola]
MPVWRIRLWKRAVTELDNRELILNAALDLFYARGYDAVGVQEIVDRAGVTKPTLYYYFGSIGPNGAGKSTTMNILTGYIEQTSGEVTIEGYNTLRKPRKAKKQIGYMPEGVPLYPELTVKEFVTYMAELKQANRQEKCAEQHKEKNDKTNRCT